jgi:hypothetical protein
MVTICALLLVGCATSQPALEKGPEHVPFLLLKKTSESGGIRTYHLICSYNQSVKQAYLIFKVDGMFYGDITQVNKGGTIQAFTICVKPKVQNITVLLYTRSDHETQERLVTRNLTPIALEI